VDALDYLHNGCQPPVIHCDLKPSNILLNQDMRAHVGDFGIARILDEATSQQPINSNSSIGIRGSIGYIAPGNSDMLLCASQNSIYLALCKCNTFLKILHMPHMLYIVSLCCRIWRRACSINLW
jgi:serine/threonine protein kinase